MNNVQYKHVSYNIWNILVLLKSICCLTEIKLKFNGASIFYLANLTRIYLHAHTHTPLPQPSSPVTLPFPGRQPKGTDTDTRHTSALGLCAGCFLSRNFFPWILLPLTTSLSSKLSAPSQGSFSQPPYLKPNSYLPSALWFFHYSYHFLIYSIFYSFILYVTSLRGGIFAYFSLCCISNSQSGLWHR